MYETAWLGVFGLATLFSSLQLFFHKGGVTGTLATMIAWAVVYFSSSNILARTDAGLISTNNPMVTWFAVFMVVVHALVLIFVLAGVGAWSEEDTDAEGMASVATEMGDQL